MKILSIIEKTKTVNLPNGYYIGYWSSDFIQLTYNGKEYEIKTEIEAKGVNIPVNIAVKDNQIDFETIKNWSR